MENKEQQILAEIRTMMASLRQQMETLDAKMAQLQQLTQSDDEELTPIVLDIDTFAQPAEVSTVESVEAPVEEPATDVVEEPVEDLPSDDLPFDLPVEDVVEEPVAVVAEEPVEQVVEDLPMELVVEEVVEEPVEAAAEEETVLEEPVVEVVDEPVIAEPEIQQEPVAETQPEPAVEKQPEPVEENKPLVQEAIIDVMTEKQAWRTAMPGTPVKDVRLAISLHERVLFINHLFSEDPMAFQAAVNKVNASESLEQVVEYVKETYPQWNLESDLVYRFMMAVRRKIR